MFTDYEEGLLPKAKQALKSSEGGEKDSRGDGEEAGAGGDCGDGQDGQEAGAVGKHGTAGIRIWAGLGFYRFIRALLIIRLKSLSFFHPVHVSSEIWVHARFAKKEIT